MCIRRRLALLCGRRRRVWPAGNDLDVEKMSLDAVEIDRFLEALLFVADGAVSVDDLAKALQAEPQAVREAAARLHAAGVSRGVQVAWAGERLQMVTAPEACEVIERYLGVSEASKLSGAALETLSIIAYRQPVTRAQVDMIRGVNSDGVIRSLLSKGLIAAVGRLNQAGRPMLYGTTMEFLQYFGIHSLDELPNLPELPEVEG